MKRRNYKIFTTIMLAVSIVVGTIGASLPVYAAEPDNDTLEGADEM